jgi:heme-degrading monooxygenase HmoA
MMIMRITWGKLYPNTWDEFERVYKETLAGKEVKGLRGRWLGRDVHDPDGGFAVSVWETLDDLQAYEHSAAYQEMYAPRLRPFFSGEYTTYRCEVKYSQ